MQVQHGGLFLFQKTDNLMLRQHPCFCRTDGEEQKPPVAEIRFHTAFLISLQADCLFNFASTTKMGGMGQSASRSD